MNKQELVQLTSELYRLTLLFPKKEPLRHKIRELADNILSKCARADFNFQDQRETMDLNHDLEALECFFKVAAKQNWVSPTELLSIAEKYANLKQESEDFRYSRQQAIVLNTGTDFDFDDSSKGAKRRDEILKILKQKGKAQVWEFKKAFPNVSKRTLRRDFEKLLSQGQVQRIGERNETYYQLAQELETTIV